MCVFTFSFLRQWLHFYKTQFYRIWYDFGHFYFGLHSSLLEISCFFTLSSYTVDNLRNDLVIWKVNSTILETK